MDILTTDLDELIANGIHEGMHRYGTRYTDFLPFLDKLTNLLFNVQEDVTIERWAGLLMLGASQLLHESNERISNSEGWLENHFGDNIPEHIKFAFGILYYGTFGELPGIMQGKAREELEKDDVKEALNETFDCIPKIQDEAGNISVNKEPTPMEITRAAKMRVDIMREKILPIYKRLLMERIEQLLREGKFELGCSGETGGEEIDLDSLPPEIRQKLEKELEKFSQELDDKTKETSPDWQRAQKEKQDAGNKKRLLAQQGKADKLTDERLKREEEGRRLSDHERFARLKNYMGSLKSCFNEYQLNLDVVKRLVHTLTGQMANIIRENAKPKWVGGLKKGKDIDWDRFFISSMSGFTDDRYWRDRIIPTQRSIKFTLVIDESGSMHGERGENALLASIVFMDTLHNLGIDFNVRGFGPTTYLHKAFRNQKIPGKINSYDTISQRDSLIKELVESMATGIATADGDALQAAIEDTLKHGAEHNIIIVITDGEGNSGIPISEALENAEKQGIKVIGIGIGEGIEYVAKNYKHYIQIPDIEMLPIEFKHILRKEIESLSMNLSRGSVDEIRETHPAINKAANAGNMFAVLPEQIKDLPHIDNEELADIFMDNLIDIADRNKTRTELIQKLNDPIFKKNLLQGFMLMQESLLRNPASWEKPVRLCIVVEDTGLPTIVFKDPYNNLIAHAGKGRKTDTPYVSIYAGYNSLKEALKTNKEDSFKEIVSHEIRDIERGYHIDEPITEANELYKNIISQCTLQLSL
ncbi:MAG: hypothetical protein AUJ70_01585 [Candidatus Omnitrophica bacterium CG1_02_40_15]|nr:MAG: hypothetical protein AUJ70_01585 [Candidatus Omnitrophica bacterium CG1_02_40_15]